VTDKLFFNGVSSATGQYGLQPMSAEALAEHVLRGRYAVTRQRQDLQRSLIDRTLNEQKILDILACLVEDIVTLLEAAPTTARHWATGAATRILEALLGPDAAPTPDDHAFLADRLTKQPVETIVRMAHLLQAGQGFALTQWLFERQDLATATLRDSLTTKFDRAVNDIRHTYLSSAAEKLQGGDPAQRRAWVIGLTRALARLPMDALQALPGAGSLRQGVLRLAEELEAICAVSDIAQQTDLQRRLAALRALGAGTSWYGIVMNLRDFLLTCHREGVVVDGPDVRNAIAAWLEAVHQRVAAPLGVVPWIDAADLSQAGWGVIFPATLPAEEQAAIEAALSPLLKLRAQQADSYYRCYAGHEGYRPGDTARDFLQRPPRRAVAANPAVPAETGVPYYLLLIGSPEQIPFDFQYELDVQYAVGRLDFGDDIAAYRRYAHNVVAAEGAAPMPRQRRPVVFFGTHHPGDAATALSSRYLIAPLVESVRSRISERAWHLLPIAPDKASKVNLLRLLRLDPSPALLFMATHGLELESGHPQQQRQQGALLCQEWGGVGSEVSPEAVFSAQDVTPALNLRGAIIFLFACFSVGTPRWDAYHRAAFQDRAMPIAERPFVATLPKAMLALRDRGALAVVGHVERVWGLSFLSEVSARPERLAGRKHEHIEVFAAIVEQLLSGQPVGAALDFMNMRYAALATELIALYDRIGDPPTMEDVYQLVELWTASHDARGYVLLGDPAVHLSASLPMDDID
jgi:hypothetical protein